ncbi:MAG: hypothetical protein GY749_40815 [Desulfobacteraceae bacterium]|nr:hypothetical protein [Desulfobacteraceae bacterium]
MKHKIRQFQVSSFKFLSKKWIWYSCGLILFVIILAIANNNISVSSVSEASFKSRLDNTMALSLKWLEADAENMMKTPNAALFLMIADMADLSGNDRLNNIIEQYKALSGRSVWRRLIDKESSVFIPGRGMLDQLEDYQRWIVYAIEPVRTPVTEDEKISMFAPDSHYWGSLTHQLFSLYIYREHQGASTAIEELTDHLCERIAFEAVWDIRVTDLYLQRIAFILAAGRDDLIKKRWVERLIAYQQDNGGWLPGWYGWGPDIFKFRFKKKKTTAHATVQGMWVLWMLKYRYPEWITRNYGD